MPSAFAALPAGCTGDPHAPGATGNPHDPQDTGNPYDANGHGGGDICPGAK